jgi:hypothetical protein
MNPNWGGRQGAGEVVARQQQREGRQSSKQLDSSAPGGEGAPLQLARLQSRWGNSPAGSGCSPAHNEPHAPSPGARRPLPPGAQHPQGHLSCADCSGRGPCWFGGAAPPRPPCSQATGRRRRKLVAERQGGRLACLLQRWERGLRPEEATPFLPKAIARCRACGSFAPCTAAAPQPALLDLCQSDSTACAPAESIGIGRPARRRAAAGMDGWEA